MNKSNSHSRPKRVLVTGYNGYIGSVLTPVLVQAGYDVVGMDTGFFRPCSLVPDAATVPEIQKDIRDVELEDLKGFDSVVHLAALSNDPIGNLNSTWTEEINQTASVRLAELAADAGVRRFLVSSSCIMYGMSEASVVNEESPLCPQTDYARAKAGMEAGIRELAPAKPGLSPTFLRNGTVYGLSPRMRFDTVFNDMVGRAVTTGTVSVYSDGKPWRPVVHVQDVARAFLAILEAPIESVHNQAFNVGTSRLNHQIIDLARIVVETVPGARLEVLARPGADQRTYQTDFSKFARTFPDFRFEWNARTGAAELYRSFLKRNLTWELFTDSRFTRLKWLQRLLDSGQLNDTLRWEMQKVAGA